MHHGPVGNGYQIMIAEIKKKYSIQNTYLYKAMDATWNVARAITIWRVHYNSQIHIYIFISTLHSKQSLERISRWQSKTQLPNEWSCLFADLCCLVKSVQYWYCHAVAWLHTKVVFSACLYKAISLIFDMLYVSVKETVCSDGCGRKVLIIKYCKRER